MGGAESADFLRPDRDPGTDSASPAFAWIWMVGTGLAGAALILLAILPPLPTRSGGITEWLAQGNFQLAWAGELLFVATIAMGAGAVGVFVLRGNGALVRRAIGLVALGVTLVAQLIALLALGRLVYPVVDVDLTSDTVVLLASVVCGSVHLALLGLAVAALALPLPGWFADAPRTALVVRIVFGALFVVGSFPWLLPIGLNLAVGAAVVCWGVLIGVAVLLKPRIDQRYR